MIKPSADTLLHHTSSPTKKHGHSLQLLQEDPAHTEKEKTLNSSLYNLGGKLGHIETVDQCGDMASRTAHDLTNILTAIQGNTELAALDLPQDSVLQRYLQNILAASQRGQECLEQLLKGMPHRKTSHEELDFCLLVDEVLEVFQATLPSNITLKKITRLPTGRMMGHATQLFRMVSNLISNAVSAMAGQEQGTLTIILDKVLETDWLPTLKQSGATYLKLMIQDTGAGMSTTLSGKIFDPCFTTGQNGRGLGLGLAIVKEVVTEHDGLVKVESEPQRGSTFTVYFPQYSPPQSQTYHSNQLAS